jgi:hypothetical protein
MNLKTFQSVYLSFLFVFAGILSVSGTIALRNVLHAVLLVVLFGYMWFEARKNTGSMVQLAFAVPLSVWLWCAYLLLFPLIAPDGAGALSNLLGKGMWGESVLTWLLAWGSFLILGAERLSLWRLALVSAVPVFIHLALTALAWGGVLQPAFYEDPSLQQAGQSLLAVLTDFSQIKNASHAFPMGFRGIEPMHGNLGYPASQAMCLSLAVMFAAWVQADRGLAIRAGVLVSLCFVSVVIAQSRAAAYFGLLILVMSCLIYGIFIRNHHAYARGIRLKLGRSVGYLMLGIGVLCLVFFWKVVSHNQVWYSMWDKMAIGFQVEAPKDVLCNGLTSLEADSLHQKNADKDDEYMSILLTNGFQGDGGRVLLARVGAELSTSYLWGWNGGRDAYQHRIAQLCGHVPVMDFSHAHNAWINLILALGWAGAILYAWVFFNFSKLGWGALRTKEKWPAAMALLLLSVFWLLRGMTDAVYQEHYLQMQAFFLMVLVLQIRSGKPAFE